MANSNISQEALTRATQSASVMNYAAIFSGFESKGIPADDVKPRENVFTYDAWRALGRQVRKGEHGVKVCTWVPMTKKDENGEPQPIGRKPRSTTVFHISQTEEISSGSSNLDDSYGNNPGGQKRAIAEKAIAKEPEYYSTEFTPL